MSGRTRVPTVNSYTAKYMHIHYEKNYVSVSRTDMYVEIILDKKFFEVLKKLSYFWFHRQHASSFADETTYKNNFFFNHFSKFLIQINL